MKKITLLFLMMLAFVFTNETAAQTLNQNAAWPNATWTVTGVYNVDPLAFEADPTTTANFAFDDDDAGNPSSDEINAESPIIDLTAANGAGETWITVSGDYVYNINSTETLQFEYWDADAMTWNIIGSPLGESTVTPLPTNDFCTGTASAYTTDVLNIVAFTPTQLSGFKYRIAYDDDPAVGGSGWEWGFCFTSPTITSATPPSCPDPTALTATPTSPTEATIAWTESGTATLWDIELVDITAAGTATGTPTATGVANPYLLSGLTAENDYEIYVRSDCGGTTSGWTGPVAFTTPGVPPANDNACDAIMLNIGDASSGAFYTNAFATLEASEVAGACYFLGDDPSSSVWFSFVAPALGEVLIQTEELAGDGSLNDTQITLFTLGNCADLSTATEIDCDEDDDDDVVGDGAGLQANLQASGLTAGTTYYFVVDGYGTATGTFDVSLTVPALSVESVENENAFAYFPNPVKNELTLNAQKDIQNVSVYNMLGQEVLRTAPNSVDTTISMNELSQGAYFVQVTIGDVTETVRIIKQ